MNLQKIIRVLLESFSNVYIETQNTPFVDYYLFQMVVISSKTCLFSVGLNVVCRRAVLYSCVQILYTPATFRNRLTTLLVFEHSSLAIHG